MKSFLRWAGSKKQLLPDLKLSVPHAFKRYVEPFAGSARLFFDLSPKSALLGDINSDLIHTYATVRTHWREIALILSSFRRNKTTYYRLRSQDSERLSATHRAARFIYLNRYCFNGLYRTNMRGDFNVPYGGNKTGDLPTKGFLQQAAKLLRRATLIAGPFEETLSMVRRDDFVYLDPPYARTKCRAFTEYNGSGFGIEKIVCLRGWLERLAADGIAFLVTYADCAEGRMLGRGFPCHKVSARRSIAGFVGSRTTVNDLIIHFDRK